MPRDLVLKDIRILLVDDELDLLAMTRARLELDGAEIIDAADGAIGLEKFKAGTFDAVVTDIRMPNMDGCKLIQSIRKTDQETPIIVMSGFSDYSDEEMFQWGANQCFRKPLPIKELIQKIISLVEQRKAG